MPGKFRRYQCAKLLFCKITKNISERSQNMSSLSRISRSFLMHPFWNTSHDTMTTKKPAKKTTTKPAKKTTTKKTK